LRFSSECNKIAVVSQGWNSYRPSGYVPNDCDFNYSNSLRIIFPAIVLIITTAFVCFKLNNKDKRLIKDFQDKFDLAQKEEELKKIRK
jgi:hypothetical protein